MNDVSGCFFLLIHYLLIFRFGEGYIVQLRVQGDFPDMQPVMDYIIENIPQAILKVSHLEVND